ncbi:ribonuclease HIII [Mycoplasma struthionis]|uniref:Ribonuclease n=1 Tax=Mycoplasma struthionis TaxID=538220 RepID=A0A3G8LII7_9MOLU|nr:ribonuclease HIII [Mycoplasma struthionis]AZG68702.1 ribonuclease HIII [Mycoplasma struthionis]
MTSIEEKYKNFIGIDETGVGDYFTPVVSVACYIKPEFYNEILNSEVKDSKKLSTKKIIELYDFLKNKVHYSKTLLTQRGYNKLINSKINNNEIKTLIHSNSLNQLVAKNNLENIPVLIDQYVVSWDILEKHFIKLKNIDWLNFSNPVSKLYLETKGESKCLAVACASIIARYLLLEHMKRQNELYNFNFKLGASLEVDKQAAEFIKLHGESKLALVAKISFKTTEKAKKLL